MKLKRITGKLLNEKWNVNAKHALYREDGKWYHHLREFPGALFDKHGYILFISKNEYINCNYLQHAKDLHCPNGISSIQGYVTVMD